MMTITVAVMTTMIDGEDDGDGETCQDGSINSHDTQSADVTRLRHVMTWKMSSYQRI